MATMPVAAGDARHMVVEMADEFRAVVGGRDGPGGRIVRAGVVTVMTTWGPKEGEGDAESVAIKELRFGVGQGGGRRHVVRGKQHIGEGGSGVASMRVRVVGGEEVTGNGLINVRTHVAYVLRLEMAGGSSRECVAHRFSDFAALLDRIKEGGVPGGSAAGPRLAVEGWARRLLIERRHTGSRARAEGVVTTRCKLLQKLMDELMALSEFASSPEIGAFLFG